MQISTLPNVDFSAGNSFFQAANTSVYQTSTFGAAWAHQAAVKNPEGHYTGMNFREFNGIMTPSSNMGHIQARPGGPLSRGGQRRNRTSHMQTRSIRSTGYDNTFDDSTCRPVEVGIGIDSVDSCGNGPFHTVTTVNSGRKKQAIVDQSGTTYISKDNAPRLKGVY